MSRALVRLFSVVSVALLGLTVSLVYWQVVRSPDILARPDNPRPFEESLLNPRGTITDRQGRVLAESVLENRRFTRRYYYPPLVHTVGLASARYGNSGVEARYNDYLTGEAGKSRLELWWNRTLHHETEPHDLALTLDLTMQRNADVLLGDRNGAVVLMESATGRILILASHPYFDPHSLEQNWLALNSDSDRPFLGRATQGLYTSSLALKIVALLLALDRRDLEYQEAYDIMAEYPNSDPLPGSSRLGMLLDRLTLPTLVAGLKDFRLDLPVSIGIATVPGYLPHDLDVASPTITPLHMALIMAVLANGGSFPVPHLVDDDFGLDDAFSGPAGRTQRERLSISTSAISAVVDLLTQDGSIVGGSEIVGLADDILPHSVFMGYAPARSPKYCIAVVIENAGADGRDADNIARDLLLQAESRLQLH